jgi:hypothetical protein
MTLGAAPFDIQLAVDNTAHGVVVLRDGKAIAGGAGTEALFAIRYSSEADPWRARDWQDLEPDDLRVEGGGREVWVTVGSFAGTPVRLTATGVVDDHGDVAWSVTAQNGGEGTLVAVAGPHLQHIVALDDDALYIPDHPGQRLPRPWQRFPDMPYIEEYPLTLGMQYFAYEGKGGGIAFHVHDQRMAYKEFIFGGTERAIMLLQYPFVGPGETWSSPSILWQPIDGDWRLAAKRYRAWFETWAQRPELSPRRARFRNSGDIIVKGRPADGPETPDNFKIHEVGTYAAALDRAREHHAAGRDAVTFVGWYGEGHDTTFPDYLPGESMGGEEGFRELTDGVHQMGLAQHFYTNARLGNVTSPTVLAHPEWVVDPTPNTPYGQPIHRDHYGDQDFFVMCPGAPGYQQHMLETVLRLVRDHHAGSIFLDQVAGPPSMLCFNRDHDHATPATAWAEGYSRMLSTIREAARGLDPEVLLSVEGAWEGSGQFIDVTQGGCWPVTDGSECFGEMYHFTFPWFPIEGFEQ